MNDKDAAWQAAAAIAQTSPPLKVNTPPPMATVRRHSPQPTQSPNTTQSNDGALTDALLLTTPTLAGLAILGIIESSALMDAPGVWVVLLATLAIGITTLAAALETTRAGGDAAHTVWPMLLIWPITYALHMGTREKLGQPARLLSGLLGAVVLTGAAGLSLFQIHDARAKLTGKLEAVQQALQPTGEAIAEDPSGDAARDIDERIQRLIDAAPRE